MNYVFIFTVSLALVLYTIQTFAAWFRYRNRLNGNQNPYLEELPSISILKPLKGIEDQLEENLSSFCELDYPNYEIIFCLQDPEDPAIPILRRLMARYPHRLLTLVIHGREIGLNPKVNNLEGGYRKARFDRILISDSNVRVRPDYLKVITACLSDPDVGLVSNMILGTGARSLGALFENLHLNSFVISSISFLDGFRNHQIVVGKSMFFTRKILEEIGGLEVLQGVLAEDYVMGQYVRKTGKRVCVSPYLIYNVNIHWSLARFWKRHTRWGQMRHSLAGPAYIMEMIINPVFLSLIPLFAGYTSTVSIGAALVTSFYKSFGDYLLGKRLGADLKGKQYLLVPLKDIMVGFMWFYPLLFRTVNWKGHTYRIASGSRLCKIEIPEDFNWPRRLLFKLRMRLAA